MQLLKRLFTEADAFILPALGGYVISVLEAALMDCPLWRMSGWGPQCGYRRPHRLAIPLGSPAKSSQGGEVMANAACHYETLAAGARLHYETNAIGPLGETFDCGNQSFVRTT